MAGPSRARRFVAETVRDHHARGLVDDAVLLTSELVTNAIEHGATPISVHVFCDPSVLRVEVHDAGAQGGTYGIFAGPYRLEGRGMALVDAIADDWGITPAEPVGKAVWFRLGSPARLAALSSRHAP